MNWNTAVKQKNGRVSIGIVIRDFEGVVDSRSLQKYMHTDSFVVELQGSFQAVMFARELGLRKIILERDALEVVNSIKNDSFLFHIPGVLL